MGYSVYLIKLAIFLRILYNNNMLKYLKIILILAVLVVISSCTLFNQSADNNEINTDPIADSEENKSALQTYSFEIGRSDPDIRSKKTYQFTLPAGIDYEIMGVDASSAIIKFQDNDKTVFTMYSYDYVRPEEQMMEIYQYAAEISNTGGHTNVLELNNDDYQDEMEIFANSLTIGEEKAF